MTGSIWLSRGSFLRGVLINPRPAQLESVLFGLFLRYKGEIPWPLKPFKLYCCAFLVRSKHYASRVPSVFQCRNSRRVDRVVIVVMHSRLPFFSAFPGGKICHWAKFYTRLIPEPRWLHRPIQSLMSYCGA